MANWSKITSIGNVEDRRGMAPVVGGGLGITGLAIVLLFTYLSGGDMGSVLSQVVSSQTSHVSENAGTSQYEGQDEYETFISAVLGSANDMWRTQFKEKGLMYREPKLVLFRTATASSCGGAQSYSGPHYCPADETIYMDETFFDELTAKLGAQGGDVAHAYVVAHEVGHHAQHLLNALPANASNAASVRTELQADCFAGLWAASLRDLEVFEPGEIKEAMDAAAAVGDDRIQQKTTGTVNPESWTHGSSEQRVQAFMSGYGSGSIDSCEG